jgi:hypothetical protein
MAWGHSIRHLETINGRRFAIQVGFANRDRRLESWFAWSEKASLRITPNILYPSYCSACHFVEPFAARHSSASGRFFSFRRIRSVREFSRMFMARYSSSWSVRPFADRDFGDPASGCPPTGTLLIFDCRSSRPNHCLRWRSITVAQARLMVSITAHRLRGVSSAVSRRNRWPDWIRRVGLAGDGPASTNR